MSEVRCIEGLVLASTSVRVQYGLPRAWVRRSGSTRIVTEVHAVWRLTDGQWQIGRVTVTSAPPLRDGVTPSTRSKDQDLGRFEIPAFLDAFPEVGTPPAARVTITDGQDE